MRTLTTLLIYVLLTGCASHATFEQPDAYTSFNEEFKGETFHYSVLYSQPEPGFFSGGEQQDLNPLSKSRLSVVSERSLSDVEGLIERHLPAGIAISDKQESTDYQLEVAITAHSKHGPTAWDFEFLKSLGVGLVSFGLGPDYWDIVANFDVNYNLENSGGTTLLKKEYKVRERVDHQAGPFDTTEPLKRSSESMFEQQLAITLNDFFEKVDRKVRQGDS